MDAKEALKAGDLAAAIGDLQAQIRRNPASAELRTFLFQLLALEGQWERALRQLELVGELDAGTQPMVHTYRAALQSELLRQEVFSGGRTPPFVGEPAPWMGLLVAALKLHAEGEHERSQQVRDEAFAAAPAVAGTIDGGPFEWIADADPRLGPILEAVVNGSYHWVPLERLSAIRMEKPADLRDVVWMPAYFTWCTGGETVGFIPTRYPGSERSPDPQIRLARKTEWQDHGGDVFTGLGQRMLATDAGEHALMDVREIRIDSGVAPASADPSPRLGNDG